MPRAGASARLEFRRSGFGGRRGIAARFEVQSGIGRVTALVGPPGTGKTTTLVKLAVVEGLRAGRSVRLISADTQRIGGADQLRTFATILGVPFQAVDSSSALAQAIDAAASADIVLIDTPGYRPPCSKS